MKIVSMVFTKKSFFRVILDPKMTHWITLWIHATLRIYFSILHSQRSQEVYRNYINVLSGKKLDLADKVILGPKNDVCLLITLNSPLKVT